LISSLGQQSRGRRKIGTTISYREQPNKGGEVEGQAKEGTCGWDEVAGNHSLHLLTTLLYLIKPSTHHAPHHRDEHPTRRKKPPDRARIFAAAGEEDESFVVQQEAAAKMSWQTYVDEHLMCEIEGHHLTSAAIVGHDGTVWAQSAAFPQVTKPPIP
jgi:hypothetical protein